MAQRLLLLNGVAILCVVLFHATGFGFTAMFAWAHRYRDVGAPNYDQIGTAGYYALRLVEQFVVFCIPAFLFVSGYFVSVVAGRARTVGVRAMVPRIKTLLWPYLFWSAVVFLGLALEGRIFSGSRYLRMLATGATDPNYYYVPLLIQLYVLAPVVVFFAERRWRTALAVAAIVQVVVCALQYSVVLSLDLPVVSALGAALPKWLFVCQLFWFTLGVVAGFQPRAFSALLERTRGVLLPLVVGLFALGVVEWELLLSWSGVPWVENRVTLIDALYSGAAILAFLAFIDIRLPGRGALISLGGRSFGIYLVHGLAMGYAARGVYHLAPEVLGSQLLLQPLLIGLGLAVPLALMAVVNRSPFRNVHAYLFG